MLFPIVYLLILTFDFYFPRPDPKFQVSPVYTPTMKSIALVVFYLLNLSIVTSYVLNFPANYRISSKLSSTKSSDSALTRSQFISKASQLTVGVGVGGLGFLGLPKASEAAGAGVTEEDIARLKKGKEGESSCDEGVDERSEDRIEAKARHQFIQSSSIVR